MRKAKYYYNPETCNFERIKTPKRKIFLNFIGFLAIVLFSSLIILDNRLGFGYTGNQSKIFENMICESKFLQEMILRLF